MRGEIHNGEAVAAVLVELCRTSDANIGAAIVHHRCRSAHGLHGARSILQLQRPFAACPQPPAVGRFLGLHAAEPAALRGKIECFGCRIIADCAAHIAVEAVPFVKQSAGLCVEQQKAAGHGGAFIRSIICTDQHIVLAGIRACPVIAARIRPIPAGGLFFVCPRRVLVCDGQADKVCREFLTAPEAGVEIVTADGDWAVRLALKWVMVDPKRLQRFGIERLNRTVGKPDKHHTLGICRGCDGKA